MRALRTNEYFMAERYMPEQVLESIALTESTSNPDTFFGRYDLALERAAILMQISGAKINGKPAKDYVQMLVDERDSRTIKFIIRCCNAHKFQKLIDYVEQESLNWSDSVNQYYKAQYEQWILYR